MSLLFQQLVSPPLPLLSPLVRRRPSIPLRLCLLRHCPFDSSAQWKSGNTANKTVSMPPCRGFAWVLWSTYIWHTCSIESNEEKVPDICSIKIIINCSIPTVFLYTWKKSGKQKGVACRRFLWIQTEEIKETDRHKERGAMGSVTKNHPSISIHFDIAC